MISIVLIYLVELYRYFGSMIINKNEIAATVSNDCVTMNKTKIAAFISNNRRNISSSTVNKKNNLTINIMHGQSELDSHADSSVAGFNYCIMHYTIHECDVSPYQDDYEPINMYQLFKPPQLLRQNILAKHTF